MTYTVSLADANFGASTLTATNVTLNKTGTADATVSVSGGGTNYTVTLSNLSGNGTLGISLSAGVTSDLAGNSSAAAGPSSTFTVDNTAPTIAISAPSSTYSINTAVTYTVTYSDVNFSASTLVASDVTLNKTGTANGTVTVSGSGSTRTVTISNLTGNGTLGISLEAGTATDAAGNLAAAAGPSAAFTVDNTAPTVVLGSPSATLTARGPVTFPVTYTDFSSITLAETNVVLNQTGTAGALVSVSGTGSSRSIALSQITRDGTLGISLLAGTAADAAGNLAGTAGPSATFRVDNTAPIAPSTPVLASGHDTGISATDNITSMAAPGFVGTAETNSTVELFRDGSISLGRTNATAAGNWTFLSPNLPDGTYSISGKATDAAGNTSPSSGALLVTIDTQAPATPSAPDLAVTSDTGPSSSDNYTSDNTPEFSGTAEANARVELFRDGATSLGVTTASSSGQWTFNAPALADGVYTITARARDAAGNLSDPSSGIAITIDTTVSAITSIANQTIAEEGSTPALLFTVSDAATPAADLSVTATASEPVLIPVSNIVLEGTGANRTLTLSAATNLFGTAALTLRVVDLAGNDATTSFTVSVTSRNDPPTLASIANPSAILEDAGQQTLTLTGISSGATNELQQLTVTATSSNPTLIPHPTVAYTSPEATATLTYTPAANANGTATITVSVRDDGGTSNGGVDTVTRTFDVTVIAVNDPPTLATLADATVAEDAPEQTISLTKP